MSRVTSGSARASAAEVSSFRLRAMPRSPARPGFTLVELLIVVVIIGILAAVAIPKFANTTSKAELANVKADLHNVVLAQESYYTEHGAYASSLALLSVQGSQGVNMTIVEATADGYSATAVHPSAVPVTCAVYYGRATVLAPAVTEGVITCQ